jgi:hypothetical protein
VLYAPQFGVVVILIISLGILTCVLGVAYSVHVKMRRGLSLRLFGRTLKVFPLHHSQQHAIQREIDDADLKQHSIAVFPIEEMDARTELASASP